MNEEQLNRLNKPNIVRMYMSLEYVVEQLRAERETHQARINELQQAVNNLEYIQKFAQEANEEIKHLRAIILETGQVFSQPHVHIHKQAGDERVLCNHCRAEARLIDEALKIEGPK